MAGESRRRRLRALLETAGMADAPLDRFEQAFAHSSAVAEGSAPAPSNERLEFLGDAVLGFVTARRLFALFPDAPEGDLARHKARLASDASIALTAGRLGFGELLMLGNGERNTGGAARPSNLGDAFEAFVAALALEGGVEKAAAFIENEHLAPHLAGPSIDADAKTALQELTQARFRTTPVYDDEGEAGPAHAPMFRASVSLGERRLATGTGMSKKAAQQAAAAAALEELRSQQ